MLQTKNELTIECILQGQFASLPFYLLASLGIWIHLSFYNDTVISFTLKTLKCKDREVPQLFPIH